MVLTTQQVNVKFPIKLVEQLNKEAEKDYTNVSEVVRRAVVFYLRHNKQNEDV